jgi:dihydroorotase
MPNLKPPVVTTEQALAYRERILSALPEDHSFEPLMTLYLTDRTTPVRSRAPGRVAWWSPASSIRPGRPPTPRAA